jgi:hypothetical protein
MPADIPSFRALYGDFLHYAGSDAYHEVLLPWLPKAQEAMTVLRRYGSLEALQWRKDTPDDLCSGGDTSYYSCLERLYALSRISDLLLLPFEPVLPPPPVEPPHDDPWLLDAKISAEQRHEWWTALGMTLIDETLPFHPFYHEIVTVEQADDPQEPISLTGTLWIGFTLGQMMFCRAGVSVRGGRDHIVKEIAETSRSYWTYQRNNRRARDLSHGWGHNSQWSTDFRRDYVAEDAYHYNVDGEHPLIETDGAGGSERGWGELSVDSSIELMSNRCFVRTTEHLYDEALYTAFYSEPRTS